MIKFNTKHEMKTMTQLKGEMSQTGADRAGVINAVGGLLWGLAGTIAAAGAAIAAIGWVL